MPGEIKRYMTNSFRPDPSLRRRGENAEIPRSDLALQPRKLVHVASRTRQVSEQQRGLGCWFRSGCFHLQRLISDLRLMPFKQMLQYRQGPQGAPL